MHERIDNGEVGYTGEKRFEVHTYFGAPIYCALGNRSHTTVRRLVGVVFVGGSESCGLSDIARKVVGTCGYITVAVLCIKGVEQYVDVAHIGIGNEFVGVFACLGIVEHRCSDSQTGYSAPIQT